MKTIITIIAAMLLISIFETGIAQNNGVGINSTGATPAPSAMLDVSSASSGLLIPRMTEVQKTAIASPATGLMVYQTDGVQGFWYYNGSGWVQAVGPAGATGAIGPTGANGALNAWGLSGNAGTDSTVNFAGTTDAEALVLKTNGSERMRVNKVGRVGIGNAAPDPSALLDVASTTSGVLIPRMTIAQRNAIVSPAVGLQVFNTDCNGLNYYTGTCWLSVSKTLPNPGAITSNPTSTDFCIGQSRTYSIAAVTGATSYLWTVPAGATITSGQGTTTINVTFGNNSGSVCVSASNACETTGQSCLSIQVNPNSPVSVSIAANPTGAICPGTSVTFTATPVNGGGAPVYKWMVGSSNVGTNSAAYTTTSLTNGNIITCILTSSNACVTGSPATSNAITITVTTPVTLNMSTSTYNGMRIFNYTGDNQTFIVPVCGSQIFVKMWGAGGGGGGYPGNGIATGGSSAFVSGYLAVIPGSSLTVIVGGAGIHGTLMNTIVPGSYGGGGAGGSSNTYFTGGGGGRSAIQVTPGADAATAGGGGGAGCYSYNYPMYGGGGGAPNGTAGDDNTNGAGGVGAGKGGTISTGGAASAANSGSYTNSVAGSPQTGSAGGNSTYGGGGGGGGYYGGSGGAGNTCGSCSMGGGGGGSSYLGTLTTTTNTAGNQGTGTTPWPAGNNTDVDYIQGIGVGGGACANGGNGEVVIYW